MANRSSKLGVHQHGLPHSIKLRMSRFEYSQAGVRSGKPLVTNPGKWNSTGSFHNSCEMHLLDLIKPVPRCMGFNRREAEQSGRRLLLPHSTRFAEGKKRVGQAGHSYNDLSTYHALSLQRKLVKNKANLSSPVKTLGFPC